MSFVRVFAGWQNMLVFAVRAQHCSRFVVLAITSDRALPFTDCLPLLSLPLVFYYFSGVHLYEVFYLLIDVVAQSDFVVLLNVCFLQAVCKRFLGKLRCYACFLSRVPYPGATLSAAISSMDTGGACAILDGSGYDMATALVARETTWLGVCKAVTPELVHQLLPLSLGSSTVPAFATEGVCRLIQDGRELFLRSQFFLLLLLAYFSNMSF